jgi:hypothetical protein
VLDRGGSLHMADAQSERVAVIMHLAVMFEGRCHMVILGIYIASVCNP